jgi:hypothetical protein
MPARRSEQDRLIVREFLTELDDLEQQVFWLIAEGMRYRAIAPILGIPVNEARKASRSSEQKRERFQLLYDTGRLCGYRSASIQALQRGELTSEELARRALAHLDACASCRAEHKTNAGRLGRSFRDQVAAVLPVPTLLGWTAWLRRPWLRAGSHLTGGVRERAAALIGVGGAGAKLTAGVATVAVVAGGTIGATRALDHQPRHTERHPATRSENSGTEALAAKPLVSPRDSTVRHAGPSHRRRSRSHVSVYVAANRVQPATGSAVAVSGTAEREFGPEGAAIASANTAATASSASGGNQEAVEREFGTPAARN